MDPTATPEPERDGAPEGEHRTTETAGAPRKARPRRRPGFHLLALGLAALLFLGGLEAVLRLGYRQLAPLLGRLGNHTYSRYDHHPGDMYYRVPELDMLFMRPEFETIGYWNGYFWHHRTDRRGFRNPPEAQDTSLLVLGDSFVYGHGVEEEETLTAYLRSEHGRPAYNMGRQGHCLYQQYVLLRLYTERFQPDDVALIVYFNDFHDLTVYRTAEQIRTRPEVDRYPYGEALLERVYERGRQINWSPWEHMFRLRSVRLLEGAAKEAGWISLLLPPAPIVQAAPPPPEPPTREAWRPGDPLPEDTAPWLRSLLDWSELNPLLDYYRDLLPDLHDRLAARGASFTVVFIESRRAMGPLVWRAQRRIHNQLSRLCEEAGIPYYSLLPVLDDCPECFLPGDWHFSPEGHRRVAAFLDRAIPAR